MQSNFEHYPFIIHPASELNRQVCELLVPEKRIKIFRASVGKVGVSHRVSVSNT